MRDVRRLAAPAMNALAILLTVSCLVSTAWSQSDQQFFPLSEVHAGLKGVGRTTFEGNQITEFQVEMLGVLKNVLAPKHDAILARFSGGGIERTGVVAGMSGSPVYVDGKLVGAVAISFPFSKEPYAVITPIEDMLGVVPGPVSSPTSTAAMTSSWRAARIPGSAREDMRLIPDQDAWKPQGVEESADAAGGPLGVRLPLRLGGFSQYAVEAYAAMFRALGFEPVAGVSLSGAQTEAPAVPDESKGAAQASATELQPGSMVSLLFARGDLTLNADCTVTYRQGNKLYACGHQVFLTGPTEIPFAPAQVLATIPSLSMSFKVDAPGQVVGSIRQDRFGAIYGVVGEQPVSIPVRIRVNSTLNRQTDYHFELAQMPFLSPLLLNLGVISTVGATERAIGPSTLHLSGKIRLSNGDGVTVEDTVSSEVGASQMAGSAVATPLNYLLSGGFPELRVEGIDLTVTAQDENRAANLEQVWSTQSEVRAGDHIEVTAVLRTPSGESVTEKIPVDIPQSVNTKTLTLVVGGGTSINALQGRFTPLTSPPRDLHELVRALNRMRRNNRLYALLMAPERSFVLQGDEFPSPPPSLLQTFLADPAATSRVAFKEGSVIGDYETKATPYTIDGQQMLLMKVVNGGR